MSTTIESLRKLGLKVNGTEPTNNNIGNVINEIADDYQGGSGSAGVSSIGGVDGAITLGEGLSMSGQELQVSASGGGTQLYKHTIPVSITMGEDTTNITLEIISTSSTAITIADQASLDTARYNFDKMAAEAISSRIYIHTGSSDNYYYDMSYPLINSVAMGTGSGDSQFPNGYWVINNIVFADGTEIVQVDGNNTTLPNFSDTVTAL